MTCGSVNSSWELNLLEGVGAAHGGPVEDTVSAVLKCLRKIVFHKEAVLSFQTQHATSAEK